MSNLREYITKPFEETDKEAGLIVCSSRRIPSKSQMGARGDTEENVVPRGPLFYSQILREMYLLKKITKLKEGSLVVDVGCGHAAPLVTKILRNCGNKISYIGIDLSRPTLMRSLSRLREFKHFDTNCLLVCDDFSDTIPIKDNVADFLICHEVIEHFREEDGKVLLRELKRILSDKGLLTLTTSKGKEKPLPGHLREYSFNEFKKLVIDEGFSVIGEYGLIADSEYFSECENEVYNSAKRIYPSSLLKCILSASHPEESNSFLIYACKR